MERVGTVIEVKPERATAVVKMRRHLACERCGRCGGILGGPDQLDHRVEVLNPINARVGQAVLVSSNDRKMIFVSFMLYLVPLAALVGGIFSWFYLSSRLGFSGKQDLPGVAVGLVLMGLVYLGLRGGDNRIKDNPAYKPVITALVKEKGEPGESPADLL